MAAKKLCWKLHGHVAHKEQKLLRCEVVGCDMPYCCGGGRFLTTGSGRWMKVQSKFTVCRRCYCEVQYRANNAWEVVPGVGLTVKKGAKKKRQRKRVSYFFLFCNFISFNVLCVDLYFFCFEQENHHSQAKAA